jgi:hypothetical protein
LIANIVLRRALAKRLDSFKRGRDTGVTGSMG